MNGKHLVNSDKNKKRGRRRVIRFPAMPTITIQAKQCAALYHKATSSARGKFPALVRVLSHFPRRPPHGFNRQIGDRETGPQR